MPYDMDILDILQTTRGPPCCDHQSDEVGEETHDLDDITKISEPFRSKGRSKSVDVPKKVTPMEKLINIVRCRNKCHDENHTAAKD